MWSEDSVFTAENFLLMAELKRQKNGYWIYEESSTEVTDVLSVVPENFRRKLSCLIKEHKRVLDAVNAIQTNNFSKFARVVNDSHDDMRDLYDISCPEIDWLVKRVLELVGSGMSYRECAKYLTENEFKISKAAISEVLNTMENIRKNGW